MKTFKCTPDNWAIISSKLLEDNPKSVIAIREKMKRVLGFTTRTQMNYDSIYTLCEIHLDFYDEQKQLMFLLRFSDYLISNE